MAAASHAFEQPGRHDLHQTRSKVSNSLEDRLLPIRSTVVASSLGDHLQSRCSTIKFNSGNRFTWAPCRTHPPPRQTHPRAAVASWYCWYSDTRSFMLDSASVNS